MNCLSLWHWSKSPICEKWASKQKSHSVCSCDQKNKYFRLHGVCGTTKYIKKIVSIQWSNIACTVTGDLITLHIAMKKCVWETINLCSLVLLFLPQDYYIKLEKSEFRKNHWSTFSLLQITKLWLYCHVCVCVCVCV